MTDFLLELRSEEIPARMQERAREDLARLFAAELKAAGLEAAETITYATPRRLALIARGLPDHTPAVSEEIKGPRAGAPPQALEGFLRKTGLTEDQLTTRDGVLFAVIDRPGRATAEVLAAAVPAVIRAFPWPKSMRWGADSASTESLRWVRPLQGIVAIFGESVLDFEVAGIRSGAATVGHRFHHPGIITIGSASDYVEKLRACHVIVDGAERRGIIAMGAKLAAQKAGLELIEDEGLLFENAGLTEWPVPLLGRFDEAFLDVPPEVIQLTARVNQKYFVCRGADGKLANAFICTANVDAEDGGEKIVEGNRKVLAARLSDARFFYETDLKVPLEEQAKKLEKIVFHEKLGTVADKVERVAKLARWLVEEGIVGNQNPVLGGSSPSYATISRHPRESGDPASSPSSPAQRSGAPAFAGVTEVGSNPTQGAGSLATLAERAARLAKTDLVTGMVGEFPELQGLMGGYYAAAQGEDPAVAEAIRDHYKPVGQGDEVPTAPVTVAVSLADKLDTIAAFFAINEKPTGSRDPFALRRAALGIVRIAVDNGIRLELRQALAHARFFLVETRARHGLAVGLPDTTSWDDDTGYPVVPLSSLYRHGGEIVFLPEDAKAEYFTEVDGIQRPTFSPVEIMSKGMAAAHFDALDATVISAFMYISDRIAEAQRARGMRSDLVRSVIPKDIETFDLGLFDKPLLFSARKRNWESVDSPTQIVARVHALQAFMFSEDGANLLAGYKRAANILKKEGFGSPAKAGAQDGSVQDDPGPLLAQGNDKVVSAYTPEPAESALIAALDEAEPRAEAAVEGEDFEAAMAALAGLRAPIDAFFESVTVNDADPVKRDARLALLARMRDAVHKVADFSKIEG